MSTRQRRLAAYLAAALIVGAAFGAGLAGHALALRAHATHPSAHGAHFRAVPDTATLAEQRRARAVASVLATRAAAIRTHNRNAFLATLDPGSPAFRAAQLRYFSNLQRVPFASWYYTVDGANAAPSDGSQFLRYAAPVWLPRVVLHYAIRGFDSAPTSLDLYYTFVQRGSRWLIGSDSDDADLNITTTRDIWDFGPVTVVRGRDVVVLGHPGGRVSLRAMAAEADRDVPRVTRVWGRSWSQRVVILVPNSAAELSELLPDAGSVRQIAAVATAELVETGATVHPVGDRVLVNPDNYVRLSAAGRQVVVTHEITHVASRAATGRLEPDWLIEGLADYVGYLDLHIAPSVAAHELQVYLGQGHRLTGLPTDDDYASSNRDLARAYDESWLACRFLAQQWGQATLLRLYRVVGAATRGTTTSATDAGMRAVLHEPLATFTRQWQHYVVTVLR